MSRDPLDPHSLTTADRKAVLAATASGTPFLAVLDDQGQLQLCPLPRDRGIVTIGRLADMELAITWDAEVSGLHAKLECLSGEWIIDDDGLSLNGTHVNGRRISRPRRLRAKDKILVGRTVVVYCAATSTPAEQTVPAKTLALDLQLNDTQRRILVALCRPFLVGETVAAPATNERIRRETFYSLTTVKKQLGELYRKFELDDLVQNQKRAKLVECALQFGLVSARDL